MGAFRAKREHWGEPRVNKDKQLLPQGLWEQKGKDRSYQSSSLEVGPHRVEAQTSDQESPLFGAGFSKACDETYFGSAKRVGIKSHFAGRLLRTDSAERKSKKEEGGPLCSSCPIPPSPEPNRTSAGTTTIQKHMEGYIRGKTKMDKQSKHRKELCTTIIMDLYFFPQVGVTAPLVTYFFHI